MATKTQADMTALTPPKLRSLEDVKRFLKEQMEQVSQDKQMVDRGLQQMARLATPIKAAGTMELNLQGPAVKKKRTLNVDFPMVHVPNSKQLMGQYALVERLSEQYKFVVNTENEVKMNFARGANGANYQAAIGGFTKLKGELEAMLKQLFHALALVAEGHAPKEYKKFVQQLAQELETNEHIESDGVKTMTYAALSKEGHLIFAGYIILKNAINDQGKVAPTIYITIKWTVGGDVEVFVENEFVAPTLLNEGVIVENTKEAIKAVAQQLALEGFSMQIGNLPVSMQLREPAGGLSRDAFSAKDVIKDVTAARDELIFILTTRDPEEVDQAKAQIYMEIKALLKRKRSTTVRMRTDGNKITFTFSNLEHGNMLHPNDLEFLEDKYKLNETQLRKIVNVMNGP